MRLGLRLPRYAPATLLALLLVFSGSASGLAQGAGSLPGLDGGSLAAADLGSGDSIVVVWAAWSPRCRDIVRRVNEIESKWRGRAKVVTVNFQEEPDEIREFLEGKNLRAPVYLDRRGVFSKRNAVTTLPGLLIYKDGEVAFKGKLPTDVDSLITRTLG